MKDVTLYDALHEIMDRGFRSGDRYVYAEELAFLLGKLFTFINEDGSETTFRPEDSWLAKYDGPNPEWRAIRDTFRAPIGERDL